MNEVLLYIPDEKKRAAVLQYVKAQGLTAGVIGSKDIDRVIGELVFSPGPFDLQAYLKASGLKEKPYVKAPVLFQMPELMILCNMPEQKTDAFLSGYRAAGLQPIALKAMLTKHNILWTPYTLALHLKEEDARVRAFEKTE